MSKSHQALLILCFLLLALLLAPQSAAARTAPPVTILTPGEGSILTSPIHLTAELQPGAETFLRVALTNENNITIARQLLRITPDNQNPTHFEAFLPFEIPTQTTDALLTVTTLDEYHRPQSMRSVALILESEGQTAIQAQISSEPWLVIDEPAPLDALSGGQVTISGTITPVNGNPVRFELMKYSGAIIGSTQLLTTEPGVTFDFEIVVPYAFITTTTDVRLIVRQISEEFASNEILDSIPIVLTP